MPGYPCCCGGADCYDVTTLIADTALVDLTRLTWIDGGLGCDCSNLDASFVLETSATRTWAFDNIAIPDCNWLFNDIKAKVSVSINNIICYMAASVLLYADNASRTPYYSYGWLYNLFGEDDILDKKYTLVRGNDINGGLTAACLLSGPATIDVTLVSA